MTPVIHVNGNGHARHAQFEHSVGVTETGVEIFTLSPKGLHKPPYF